MTAKSNLIKNTVLAGLASLMLVAVGLFASVPRADANNCVGVPFDPSIACDRFVSSGYTFDICDRQADGHYAILRIYSSLSGYLYFSDTNGSAAGCRQVRAQTTYVAYTVCVQYEGCGKDLYYPNYRHLRGS